jgi:hypothetical protein
MISPHPGTPDGSTCGCGSSTVDRRRWSQSIEPNRRLQYTSECNDTVQYVSSGFLFSGSVLKFSCDWISDVNSTPRSLSEIARIRVSTTHGIPARPIAIRSVNTLHVAPVRTPVRRARASLRLSRRSARAAAPVPKRGPLRVALHPACSVCRGQYVGVTGLCCSAPRRPSAFTWPRAKRTMPAALCTSHSKAVP